MSPDDANKVANAAYIMGMTACAMIKAFGMIADNQKAQLDGREMKYSQSDFDALIDEYGIHHNATISTLFHGG